MRLFFGALIRLSQAKVRLTKAGNALVLTAPIELSLSRTRSSRCSPAAPVGNCDAGWPGRLLAPVRSAHPHVFAVRQLVDRFRWKKLRRLARPTPRAWRPTDDRPHQVKYRSARTGKLPLRLKNPVTYTTVKPTLFCGNLTYVFPTRNYGKIRAAVRFFYFCIG